MSGTALRKKVKKEVDKVNDQDLEIVYQFLKQISEKQTRTTINLPGGKTSWDQFINEMYGSMAEAPIKRWDAGPIEIREPIE